MIPSVLAIAPTLRFLGTVQSNELTAKDDQ